MAKKKYMTGYVWNSSDRVICLIDLNNTEYRDMKNIKDELFVSWFGGGPVSEWNPDFKLISWEEMKQKYNITIHDLL